MAQRLKLYPKESLLDAARVMCGIMNISVPDRICLRGRQPLICFYCEHFPEFPLGFAFLNPTANNAQGRQDHGVSGRIREADEARELPSDFVGLLAPWPEDAQRPEILTSKDGDFLDVCLALE
jgi:hypothetical protein